MGNGNWLLAWDLEYQLRFFRQRLTTFWCLASGWYHNRGLTSRFTHSNWHLKVPFVQIHYMKYTAYISVAKMGRCTVSVLSCLLTWFSSKILATFVCTVYVVINTRWKKKLLFHVWRRVTLQALWRRHEFHSEILTCSSANLSDVLTHLV